RPLARSAQGALEPVSWRELESTLRDRLTEAGQGRPDAVRFLVSAHASHEEFFLFRRLADELLGDTAGVTVSWRYRPKTQPAGTRFTVPPVDAPNVAGARIFGLLPGAPGDEVGAPDTAPLRQAIDGGRVSALYVFDPGPEGTLGDMSWILDARARGLLPLLVVQGVLMTDLARAADFVLPGASFIEKDASYTNDQGRLQAAARALAPPGEALEDWQILANLAAALGLRFEYASAAHVRADIQRVFGDRAELAGLTALAFGRPMAARHWLEASNPSERWKWDFLFQDLPPIKGAVDPRALPLPAGAIPLKAVKVR